MKFTASDEIGEDGLGDGEGVYALINRYIRLGIVASFLEIRGNLQTRTIIVMLALRKYTHE